MVTKYYFSAHAPAKSDGSRPTGEDPAYHLRSGRKRDLEDTLAGMDPEVRCNYLPISWVELSVEGGSLSLIEQIVDPTSEWAQAEEAAAEVGRQRFFTTQAKAEVRAAQQAAAKVGDASELDEGFEDGKQAVS